MKLSTGIRNIYKKVNDMDKITLTINGQEVKATRGMTVLEAALSADIYIPTLCHYPDLEPYGGC